MLRCFSSKERAREPPWGALGPEFDLQSLTRCLLVTLVDHFFAHLFPTSFLDPFLERFDLDLGAILTSFSSLVRPKIEKRRLPAKKRRCSRNIMFYYVIFIIFKVAEAQNVDFFVPGPTFSTSENDVDFYIDFRPKKSPK